MQKMQEHSPPRVPWALVTSHIWASMTGKGLAQVLPSPGGTQRPKGGQKGSLELDQLRASYCLVKKPGWVQMADLTQGLNEP